MGGVQRDVVPGTDHAGIATQMVVERSSATEGKTRHDARPRQVPRARLAVEREERRPHHQQLGHGRVAATGARERFTMGEGCQRRCAKCSCAVPRRAHLPRERLINWCPTCLTALSDLEVEHDDSEGQLWHIAYPRRRRAAARRWPRRDRRRCSATPPSPCIPTIRASSISSVRCVDLPLTGRKIPIIADEMLVDIEFGTGAVKVTPAHDFNDFEIGKRHNCEQSTPRPTHANDELPRLAATAAWIASSRARRSSAILEAQGLLEGRAAPARVGRCQRSGHGRRAALSPQWFVKTEPLAEAGARGRDAGKTKIIPETWAKTYMHWMSNIHDWCMSRQLWWGHQHSGVLLLELRSARQKNQSRLHDRDGRRGHGHAEAPKECRRKQATVVQEPTCSTPGSRRLCCRSPTLGWPDDTPICKHLLSERR